MRRGLEERQGGTLYRPRLLYISRSMRGRERDENGELEERREERGIYGLSQRPMCT